MITIIMTILCCKYRYSTLAMVWQWHCSKYTSVKWYLISRQHTILLANAVTMQAETKCQSSSSLDQRVNDKLSFTSVDNFTFVHHDTKQRKCEPYTPDIYCNENDIYAQKTFIHNWSTLFEQPWPNRPSISWGTSEVQ